MFLASFLIGLREGIEMVLVVSVLVAYLVKTDRRQHLPAVWSGVGAAAALSIGFGAVLSYVSTTVLGGPGQELFDAITSTIAVALVTWMIFWMRTAGRRISGELRGQMDGAMGRTAGLGVVTVVGIAFLAVVREGLETTLLFFASAQGAVSSQPLFGLGVGLLVAIVLGVALYLGAVRIDIGRFFTISGLLLILVAAGIFKYAVHDFQEAGVLPGLTTQAFDASSWLTPGTWYAEFLRGLINLTPQPSVLETVAWLLYLVPVLVLFLWPSRPALRTPGAAPAPIPTTQSETTEHVRS
ncbi:iron uptake transporter permease EfeU [Blastococcus sp. URHD0036]|uniref:iron uptake transporter permease EfeU n=1 Tax=Blastococcus sp. URHD0036 TaxID=1380356 RepID=UPI00049543AC|nr:iron uptake transporter permease EfeU [Blastococcus sp. URHD0036]